MKAVVRSRSRKPPPAKAENEEGDNIAEIAGVCNAAAGLEMSVCVATAKELSSGEKWVSNRNTQESQKCLPQPATTLCDGQSYHQAGTCREEVIFDC